MIQKVGPIGAYDVVTMCEVDDKLNADLTYREEVVRISSSVPCIAMIFI